MGDIGILIIGVLVVIAMLMITSVIIALAPYIAGILVVLGLCWFAFRPKRG